MMSWGCGAHLGDALWSLSYLMKCKGTHALYVLPQFVHDLSMLASDTGVGIHSANDLPANAQDTWIANGRHESGHNLFFRNQEDIMGFVFSYFNAFGNAWAAREDMLLDFQWLKPEKWRDTVLILNTQPMSGQCPGYSQEEVNHLARELTMDGQRVVKVCDDDGSHKYSLVQIACLSAHSKLIIGGASGPFFATMNTAARNVHRIVFLDPMRIDYGTGVGPIHMAKNAEHARLILKECNYLRYQ